MKIKIRFSQFCRISPVLLALILVFGVCRAVRGEEKPTSDVVELDTIIVTDSVLPSDLKDKPNSITIITRQPCAAVRPPWWRPPPQSGPG